MEGSFIGVQGSFVIGAPLPRAWNGETDREAKPKRTKLRFFPSCEKPGGKEREKVWSARSSGKVTPVTCGSTC